MLYEKVTPKKCQILKCPILARTLLRVFALSAAGTCNTCNAICCCVLLLMIHDANVSGCGNTI